MDNREKQCIYIGACNILKREYYAKFNYSSIFDPDFSFDKEDDTSINEVILDINFFIENFGISLEDAKSLIKSLIKNEKLQQLGENKYTPIHRCSICGKDFDKYDACGNNTICHNFTEGSKYYDCTLEVDLCNECYDSLAHHLLFKMKKPRLLHDYNLHLYSGNETREELKNEYKLSDDEIDEVIPF
jgi:hypothetical protein